MNKRTVIVHGPQGCGKTSNAMRLASHFGCDFVLDEWNPGDEMRFGSLHLTRADVSDEAHAPHVEVFSFDQAMQITRPAKVQFAPGVIRIAGSTSLEDWRSVGDTTKISGGSIDGTKPSNPKDGVGSRKWRQFVTVPFTVIAEVGAAMLEGGMKYARHNYRVAGVRASVYVDAAIGHIMQWWEGEDLDPDTKLSHITKAIASLVVLRDAMIQDMLNDDRPPKAKLDKVRDDLQGVIDGMFDKYPQPKQPVTEVAVRADEKSVLASLGVSA